MLQADEMMQVFSVKLNELKHGTKNAAAIAIARASIGGSAREIGQQKRSKSVGVPWLQYVATSDREKMLIDVINTGKSVEDKYRGVEYALTSEKAVVIL